MQVTRTHRKVCAWWHAQQKPPSSTNCHDLQVVDIKEAASSLSLEKNHVGF